MLPTAKPFLWQTLNSFKSQNPECVVLVDELTSIWRTSASTLITNTQIYGCANLGRSLAPGRVFAFGTHGHPELIEGLERLEELFQLLPCGIVSPWLRATALRSKMKRSKEIATKNHRHPETKTVKEIFEALGFNDLPIGD